MAIFLILIVFLLYAFAGIIGFPGYIGGVIGGAFKFFLDLIKFNIYPVGNIVYIIYSGLLVFFVVYIVIRLFSHSHN